MIRILHISDLHFCIDAQSNNMKNVLLSEARKVHNLPRGKKLLIITGDFHSFSSSDYKLAKEFIDRIVAEMDIEKEKDVFIVPGNHDVGNETALNRAGVDPMKSEAAILGLRDGRKKFLSWRLEAFVPFCQFAHEIGVYSDGDNLLPAKVHVRCWRDRLNILHLNTALVADGNTKNSQMSDIDTAVSDKTWNLCRGNIPAIALGHNSFYDLETDQQTSLKTMFVHRNVSAYLCGDTHRINVDENKQNIILESNTGIHPLVIKNVVCAKGISEAGDNYSDFGCYWHIWNEDTDKVEYKYRRLTPHTLAKTVSDSTGDGEYVMRRKSGDIMTPDNSAHSADVGLRQFFANLLLRTQENHPSFVLLKRDEIDERLFPQAAEMKQFVPQGRTEKNGPVSRIWDIIRNSWMEGNKRNIVIEGVGGIGKTVTLFSVMNIEDDILPPAVYVPMHKLIDENGNCTNLSDYLKSLSNTYGEKIIELAESSWANTPKLLVMMDGFNEVPGNMRRTVLHMLNEWYKSNPGAQLIVVSRPMDGVNLKSELNGKPLSITLEPLSTDIVRDCLGERTPPESSRIWEVLTRPLFLNLYIKTDCLVSVTADGYPLHSKRSESGGALIWNYLQRELLREVDSEKCEQWVLRCSVACEYILPYIAFRMEREHRFTITREQALEYIQEVKDSIDPQKLPDHLAEIFNEYDSRHFRYPDLSKYDWNNTIFNDIGLLKADKKSYAFLHQNFRDALAGLFLVNQAEMMENDETLPEVWRRAANHYVMDYAAELIEDHDADKLWEANRKASPTDSSATYAMMELQRRRTNKSDPKLDFGLDFSGMDLRGISLTRYMKDGNKNESNKIAMRLFGSPQLSRGTKFDINTFRSPGHIGPINCVAATEDGLCVSGSWDKTLRVWDIRTGECLHTMVGHTDSIYCVSVSENGLCVSASGDKTLSIWDMYSGDCLRVIHSDNDVFRCSNISKDWICLSGSRNNNLCVWDIRTGQHIRTLTGHTDWVTGVVTLNNDLCVSGSDDKTVRIWNINTDKCLHTLKEHTACVNCVAVTHDGLCVSGAEDNTILVWDIYTGNLIRTLTGHADWVRCVAVTEDDLCISGSYDGTMRVWDIHTGECLRKMEGHTGVVCGVAVTEDGLCVSGSWDNTIRVWDIHTGECLRIIRGQSGWVSFAVSTKNGFRISGIGDRCLRVIDIRTGERCHIMRGHTSWINCICLANDGLCVSGSDDRTIRVWDYNAGKCLQTLEGHTAWVKCVAVTDDGLCVSGSGDHTLRVWDMKTGECLRTMVGHDHQVNCMAVTKDGKCISSSDDRTLRVWDIQTGECLHVLEGHTDSVYRVTVTDDGLCVSESDDETFRKWNIHTGECIDVRYPMEIETAGMDFTEANLTPKLAKALWQNNAAIPTADYEQYVKPDTSLIKNE